MTQNIQQLKALGQLGGRSGVQSVTPEDGQKWGKDILKTEQGKGHPVPECLWLRWQDSCGGLEGMVEDFVEQAKERARGTRCVNFSSGASTMLGKGHLH